MSIWSTLMMMSHMAREPFHRHALPRVPEPDLVMDAPAQVQAYAASGDLEGPLAPIHLLLAVHASVAMPPGGVVLDMACGPCNQLARIARLHPGTRFIGLDASPGMLSQAEASLREAALGNVTLRQGDMRALAGLADASVDAVMCTMSLHHLADTRALQQAMRSAARVLKPGGGVYLADFGRLRRLATIRFLVQDRQAEQSPQFTADFFNSMRAAFSVDELADAAQALGSSWQIVQTALAPFMVLLRRPLHGQPDAAAMARAREQFRALSASHRGDFKALANWFAASGLPLPAGVLP
ncbi:methyltransferase domain-containing protein [Aquabacterium sp.]|uniref:class I SAM-dependent methyltransferase n=1 Tax=Aquabacterium sp. TaxID=1872578 RepID=UPI0035B3E95C